TRMFPGLTRNDSGERFFLTLRQNLSISPSARILRGLSCLGFTPPDLQYFSVSVNRIKKTRVKADPAIVAVFFVNKLTLASNKRMTVVRFTPRAPSIPFKRKLNGTFHRSASGSVKRSTTTASAFIAKLHTTPKAYASPSR